MCVRVSVGVFVCVWGGAYVRACGYVSACVVHICTCACLCLYVSACVGACVGACVWVRVCVCARVSVRVSVPV